MRGVMGCKTSSVVTVRESGASGDEPQPYCDDPVHCAVGAGQREQISDAEQGEEQHEREAPLDLFDGVVEQQWPDDRRGDDRHDAHMQFRDGTDEECDYEDR